MGLTWFILRFVQFHNFISKLCLLHELTQVQLPLSVLAQLFEVLISCQDGQSRADPFH